MKNVKNIKKQAQGEFDFIEKISSMVKSLPANGYFGIGDDCALLPMSEGRAMVFTSDMLQEGVHFLRSATSAHELGRKSLAVNLSDVAAMGARPTASLLAISLPKECMGQWADEFMEGYCEMSREHGVALIGGDTTSSLEGVTISVTAIGEAALDHIKYRSGAKVGDLILVSGTVGESGAGLQDILRGEISTPNAMVHKNPTPHTKQGAWLGARTQVHAMMDISDGIASDIRHIMQRSGVGAIIDIDRVPTPVDPKTALCAGEDYKLLLTASAQDVERLMGEYSALFEEPLTIIGEITSGGELQWRDLGQVVELDWNGFRHY